MFGSTRDYGLRPGGYSSNPYTASGMFSSGGLMGGIGALNPFGGRSNAGLYGIKQGPGAGFTWIGILGYIVSILTMLIIILLLVHYFIYPVFQINPGGPGFIPVPGLNDSETFWKPGAVLSPIKSLETVIGKKTYNISMVLDIMIKNPQTFSTEGNRVFFSRGMNSPEPESGKKGKTLAEEILSVALAANTTDMVITLVNMENNPEPIYIPNVPVLTPFRLGIVIMDKAIEVYINGKLLKTRRLSASPKEGGYTFYPPQASMAQVVRINNLILWDRAITAPEIRYATPALMVINDSDITSYMPSGEVCGTNPVAAMTDMVTNVTGQDPVGSMTDAIKNMTDE